MAVLMNKGDNPRRAAWLFYSDRASFEAMAQAIRDERLDAGRLVADEGELAQARKASSEVTVYLEATALVPDDVDLDELIEDVCAETTGDADKGAGEGSGPAGGDDGEGPEAEAAAPYEPVPVSPGEGARVRVGATTAQAARAFLVERELGGGETWTPELPGLQALAVIERAMASSAGGVPNYLVWHIDPDGIMRMAPAKEVRPMAGNVLKAKL